MFCWGSPHLPSSRFRNEPDRKKNQSYKISEQDIIACIIIRRNGKYSIPYTIYIHSCFIFIYACVYYCVNQVCRISGDLVHFSPDFRMVSRNPRPFGHATVFRIAGRHNVFVMCISFLKNLFLKPPPSPQEGEEKTH